MVDDTLLRSSERMFQRSGNRQLRSLADPGTSDTAEYSPDKVFLGWRRGGKEMYDNLLNKALTYGFEPAEARRYVRQHFGDAVGQVREPVFLDRASANVVFIAGERGSGKSFLLRALSNRSARGGVNNVLIDPAHEFYTNNQYTGIQKELANLRPQETRQTIKTKVLMPYFVWKARQEQGLPEDGYNDHFQVFKFEFTDLDANDFDFLLRQKYDHEDTDIFIGELQDHIRDGAIRSWQDVIDLAEQMQQAGQFSYSQRARQYRSYIENNYQKWGFLGSDKPIDLAQLFEEYNTIALSLHDDDYLRDQLRMKELYVAILVKRVRKAVLQGEIAKPIEWKVDEAHTYVPADTDPQFPPSKQQFRKGIKQDRKRGFRIDLASQEPSDVQRANFLNQCRYFLLPFNMKPGPRRHLLQATDVYAERDRMTSKWQTVFRAMDEYQWLLVDNQTNDWAIIEVASPLANHLQE